jgi:hypothetical protein
MKNHTSNNKKASRRQFLAITIAVIGIMSVTVGCGGGGGNTNPNATPTPSGATPTPSGATPTPNPTPTPGGANLAGENAYFPTKTTTGAPGEWQYSEVGTQYTNSDYYAGTASFNGQTVHQFISDPQNGYYIALTSEGIATAGSYDTFGNKKDETVYTNYWVARFDMSPGQSRDYTMTETSTHQISGGSNTSGSMRYTLTRLPDETVTVPAGTFNCIVFQVTILEITGNITPTFKVGEVDKLWLASGVGLVQSRDTDSSGTSTNVLTSYAAYKP